jgi:hypothetical protein
MISLEQHLLHRERLQCPLIARAWAGTEAAARTQTVRDRYAAANEWYGTAWRRWNTSGDNLKAIEAADYGEICRLMIELWADKRGPVGCEDALVDLERRAA